MNFTHPGLVLALIVEVAQAGLKSLSSQSHDIASQSLPGLCGKPALSLVCTWIILVVPTSAERRFEKISDKLVLEG